MKRINALTIAGTDPSGGAGIRADLKTFSALWLLGDHRPVAQNTRGVQSVYRIEPDFVAAQLDSVFSDVRIDTTKIGMLAETDIVEAVAERLARYRVANVVLDTVMLAKSGDPLLSASAVDPASTIVAAGVIDHPEPAGSGRATRCPMRVTNGKCWSRAGAAGAGLRRGIDEGRPSRRCRKPDWLFTREGEQRFTAPRVQTKIPTAPAVRSPRWRRCAASRGLGGHRYRGEGGCRRLWRRPTLWR